MTAPSSVRREPLVVGLRLLPGPARRPRRRDLRRTAARLAVSPGRARASTRPARPDATAVSRSGHLARRVSRKPSRSPVRGASVARAGAARRRGDLRCAVGLEARAVGDPSRSAPTLQPSEACRCTEPVARRGLRCRCRSAASSRFRAPSVQSPAAGCRPFTGRSSAGAMVAPAILEVHQHVGTSSTCARWRCSGPVRLRRGLRCTTTGRAAQVPVGQSALGRLLDVFGEPLDGGAAIVAQARRDVLAPPPPLDEVRGARRSSERHRGDRSAGAVHPRRQDRAVRRRQRRQDRAHHGVHARRGEAVSRA